MPETKPILSEADAREFIEGWNGSIDGDWKNTPEFKMYEHTSNAYEAEIARLREQVEGLSKALKDVDELIIHTCRPCPAPVNPPHICDCTLGDAHRLIASKLTQR